jgi:putative oxidoreductase
MNKTQLIVYWTARIVAALIMFQTLYFKFSAADESVEIFKAVDMEPWGRIAVGVMELIASILLIISATAWLGGLLGAGLMAGAVGMHLTILGIEVRGDGGYLFTLALIVLICCSYVLYVNKSRITNVVSNLR